MREAPLTAEELELCLALEEWESRHPHPPNIFEVIETGDARLIGAYILRGFRQAARNAVQSHKRVMELREFAHLALDGAETAEGFLRSPDLGLGGQTPLEAASASVEGRDEAIRQLTPQLRKVAMRVFARLSAAWDLSEEEASGLLGAEPEEVRRWQENSNEAPSSAVARVSMLLGIFRAINIHLPHAGSADGWVRRPNVAPLFAGRSALELMLERGFDGISAVRAHLEGELWGR
jgi:hypothetical protein